MKQLIIVKPGTVSDKDKELSVKNGFIIIEHPEPDSIQIVTDVSGISADPIIQAALIAVYTYESGSNPRRTFADLILKKIIKA